MVCCITAARRQKITKMARNRYPQDVKDIIEYAKLRKKYPKKDRELRMSFGFDGKSITEKQMYVLLNMLRGFDGNGSKLRCEMCGKKFNPEEDVNGKDPRYVETKNYCPECWKIMAIKHGGKKK